MNKFTESLKAIGIYNAYQYADIDGSPPYISYRPVDNGHGGQSAAWQVARSQYQTDVGAHWRDYGMKTFVVHGRDDRQNKLAEAMKWAGEKYGVQSWAKTPFNTWMDAEFVKARNAELKAQLKVASA